MSCCSKLAKWPSASPQGLPSEEASNRSFSDCVALLRGASGSLAEAKRVHHSLEQDLHQSLLLSNLVIRMYANCGAPCEAREFFDEMLSRDIFSWNFMLRAYVKTGYRRNALHLFEQMQQECTLPNTFSYGFILASFNIDEYITQGRLMHARVACGEYTSEMILQTRLISMYSKCGSMNTARSLFDEIQEKNAPPWNALMAGYAQQGLRTEAMHLLGQMRSHGLLSNKAAIVSLLSTCSSPSALDDGKWIHNQLKGMYLEADVAVNNALIAMYIKCGSLEDANKVFDKMLVQNKATFLNIISACTNRMPLLRAKRLQELIYVNGLEGDVIIQNALITTFGKCGNLREAQTVFDKMVDRDLVSWNSLLAGCSQNVEDEFGCQLFSQMLQEGVLPNKITFVSSIDVCATLENEIQGKRLHTLVSNSVHETEVILATSLIHMYGSCKNCKQAHDMFDRIAERDLPCWNSLVAAYSQCNQFETALFLFHEMQKEGLLADEITFVSLFSACVDDTEIKNGIQLHAQIACGRLASDIVIANALINMYGHCVDLKGATKIFSGMEKKDAVTFINIFSVCASHGALQEGRQLHVGIMGSDIEADVKVGNVLINMYGKCSSLSHARKVFDGMPERNVVTWNAMLSVYAQNGLGDDALDLFHVMKRETDKPDGVTFVCVLTACSHAGLVDKGCSFFCSMVQNHGIAHNCDHYNCMVDLLTRAGRLDEAEELIKRIPYGPSVVTWITLLAACKNRLDADRAVRVALRICQLYPSQSSAYVTLSNIVKAAGEEDAATSFICMMSDLNDPPITSLSEFEETSRVCCFQAAQ